MIAWGMALNKLRVFGLTQYKRVIWIDSDTFVLNNMDHLILERDFTSAFTNDCCNRNADAKMSGGLWVFTPSQRLMDTVTDMISKPVPGSNNEGWMFGDMQVVQYLFGRIDAEISGRKEWPFSRDLRQGALLLMSCRSDDVAVAGAGVARPLVCLLLRKCRASVATLLPFPAHYTRILTHSRTIRTLHTFMYACTALNAPAGSVPGLRILPVYVNITDEDMERELLQGGRRGPSLPDPGA